MDVKYINPFIIAAQSVFRTMLGMEVALNKPVIKTSRTTSGEVTGIMGLVGDKKGTITISFRDRGALFIYKTLVGDESETCNYHLIFPWEMARRRSCISISHLNKKRVPMKSFISNPYPPQRNSS